MKSLRENITFIITLIGILFAYLSVKETVDDWFSHLDFFKSEFHHITGLFLILLLLILWLFIRFNRQKKLNNWLAKFAYAGSSANLDLSKISIQKRRFDIPFSEMARALNIPWSMAFERNKENLLITNNAKTYFIQKRKQHETLENTIHNGIILEGSPYIGKSRLIAELLKHQLANTFLLVPDATRPIPEFSHYTLKHLGKQCIDIFLDDLERFNPHIEDLISFLFQLKKNGYTCFIWSTVRNGGPAELVQESEHFRPILENLERLILKPPDDEMMENIAKLAHETLANNRHHREHNFSFVEHKQFEEMRSRWNSKLAEPAKSIMRSAATLDNRGISLKEERWKKFAHHFSQVNPINDWPTNCSALEKQGFLFAMNPDPGYLMYVVDSLLNVNDSEILHYLFNIEDIEALYEWCLFETNKENYNFVLTNLTKVRLQHNKHPIILFIKIYLLLGWVNDRMGLSNRATALKLD